VRQIVTGVDGSGRSCVVEEFTNGPTGAAVNARTIFRTASSPAPTRPLGHGRDIDLKVPVGIARWSMVQWPPGSTSAMHHTDTVDFDAVLEGRIDLILDDGAHRLELGDCAVVTGVDHGWEAGPSGCTLAVLLVGTPAPE
jgi:quercetin dioxygenase-like cupin family protein